MSIYEILLRVCRFKPVGIQPFKEKKCVVIMAPHTAVVDFILGLLMIRHLKLKMIIVMKKEFFIFPLNFFLKKIGCVPVDREHAYHFSDFAANLIKEKEEVALIICPEGTRKRVAKWKRGYYIIAEKAGVPIGLSHIDFRTRTLGIGEIFYPTGDYDKDSAYIESYYYGMRGYNKGKFNLENRTPEKGRNT